MVELYRSALGKKYVMAITGMVFMGYVLAHMVGNLKLYQGAEDFNHYADFLRPAALPDRARDAARCGCCAWC